MQSRLVWLLRQAAVGGCPITPLSPWHELWGLFWEGFGDQSEISALFNRQHMLCFFSSSISVKVVPAGSIFPVQHCLMPEATWMSQPWCAQLPSLRAERWRRPQAQTKRPAIKTSWVLHWVGTTTGEYQLYQELSQFSKAHRRDLCQSWIPCSRSRGIWKALQSPVPGAPVGSSVVLLLLCYSKDSTHQTFWWADKIPCLSRSYELCQIKTVFSAWFAAGGAQAEPAHDKLQECTEEEEEQFLPQ